MPTRRLEPTRGFHGLPLHGAPRHPHYADFDLYDNWNTIKRGGVTVNLRGNKNNVGTNEVPSDEAKEKALILVQNGWNISVNGGLS